jgi:rhamnulokinase
MGQYLAFDLGAESGRALLGALDGGRLQVEELHRFPNTPVRDGDALYWDFQGLWNEIQRGIRIALNRGLSLDGIGIDTWGVDFALIGHDGKLLERPRHYRDSRNAAALKEMLEIVPARDIFGYTGIQHMQINTLVQLFAMRLYDRELLSSARYLVNIPDLFNYLLTGVARSEATIASTTQFFNPVQTSWATELLKRLDLPTELLCPIVQPGTSIGRIKEPPHTCVYATAGHDTASAVAAVPSEGGRNWCYISSGTWSLVGLELDKPVINPESEAFNCTNEVGACGTIRLLKNIAGLWLLQECRRAWIAEGVEYSYEELTRMAADARPFSAFIDPDAFIEPGDMPRKIAGHCRETGQEPPRNHGEMARAILESLAIRYRYVIESLARLAARNVEVIHIVGGGSRNYVLNQFVADCTGRRVIAGPGEATAIGNILVQAMGCKELTGLEEIRAVVRRSCPPAAIEPNASREWAEAYARYLEVVS